MKRNTAEWKAYVAARWSSWLGAHEPTISATRLARELADADTDKDAQPRAMVYGWLNGTRIPRPPSAWRAGQALQRLGWSDCGPLSLYAAGYHAKTILVLGHLAQTPEGAYTAGVLACALPIAAEVTIERQLARRVGATSVLKKTAIFQEFSILARRLCVDQSTTVASLLQRIWPDNEVGPEELPDGLDVSIRAAYLLAAHEVDPIQARGLSWPYVMDWAQRNHHAQPAWGKYHELFKPLFVDKWIPDAYMAITAERSRYLFYSRKRDLKPYIQALISKGKRQK